MRNDFFQQEGIYRVAFFATEKFKFFKISFFNNAEEVVTWVFLQALMNLKISWEKMVFHHKKFYHEILAKKMALFYKSFHNFQSQILQLLKNLTRQYFIEQHQKLFEILYVLNKNIFLFKFLETKILWMKAFFQGYWKLFSEPLTFEIQKFQNYFFPWKFWLRVKKFSWESKFENRYFQKVFIISTPPIATPSEAFNLKIFIYVQKYFPQIFCKGKIETREKKMRKIPLCWTQKHFPIPKPVQPIIPNSPTSNFPIPLNSQSTPYLSTWSWLFNFSNRKSSSIQIGEGNFLWC